MISTFWQRDEGTIALVFGMILVVLLGAAGLAVDYGSAVQLQSRVQAALDASVLAGVKAEPEEQNNVATKVFSEHLRPHGAPGVSLSFSSPVASQLAGTATTKMDLVLLRVLGMDNVDIRTQSTAAVASSGKVCAMVLDTSAPQALLVNSGAQLRAPDCEIHVHSTASNAAVFNAGTSLDTRRLCIASSSILDNGGNHPNTEAPCLPASNPYAGRFPEPASNVCTYSNLNFNGGSVTLNPGVYCGWINFNSQPNVTLNAGLYIIKNGGWNVNGGTWFGNGVTFYFADTSKIQFNSAVAATLTAPTSGSYKDVVMLEKEGLARSALVLDDSRGFNLRGLAYLPSRDTIFNSGSNLESKDFTLVVNTLILNQTNWNFTSTTTEITGGGKGMPRLVN